MEHYLVNNFDEYELVRHRIGPEEGFSILFSFYISKGPEFRQRTTSDPQLREQYNFLKREVFDGQEYEQVTPEEGIEIALRIASRGQNRN